MPKLVWLVRCEKHPDIHQHFIKKSMAQNYYKWHVKQGCLEVDEPSIVEAPYLG